MKGNSMKPKLYLINGPLGAGKTTLLRELLRQPQFEHARIIENEFASTSIDTQQLHDHHAEVQTIAGVCICCSTGDELTDALTLLANSREPVIIEATGVANSLKLIEKLVLADTLDTYDLAHAIFVLDGIEATNDIDATLRLYKNELQAADTVLISKTDLITTVEKQILIDAIKTLGVKHAEIVTEGYVDSATFDRTSEIVTFFSQLDEELQNHDAKTNYTIINLEDVSFDTAKVEAFWKRLQSTYGLRRLKGDVMDGAGNLWHVQATPGQCRVTQGSSTKAQLVFIGENARQITLQTIKIEQNNL